MSVIKLNELDEVATKRDLAELKSELKGDISALGIEMVSEVSGFRSEMAGLKQTTANWMLTVLVTVVGAMVGLAFLT